MNALRPLLLCLVLLAACGQALAQFGGGMRGGGMGGGGMGGGGMGGGRQRQNQDDNSGVTRLSANDQVRLQVTDFRLALKLSPEQNPPFDAYQQKLFDLLSDLGRGAPAAAGDSAIKQIDRKVDTARNRLAALEDLSDAARKLYSILNDEQKKTADRMMPGTVPALYSGVPGFGGPGGGQPRREY